MNQHTQRLLVSMTQLINDYRVKKTNLRWIVDALEGSLNALEEELPKGFYERWYVHWGGLEQILAVGKAHDRRDEILVELKELEDLICEFLPQ